MISIYERNQPQLRIKWAIYKGGQVKEKLDAANLRVWLVSRSNRFPIAVAYDSSGDITAEIPAHIPAGVYSLKAIWFKNVFNSPQERKGMSEVQNVLAVQTVQTEDCLADDKIIHIKSEVNTSYGYDGMDAYELAVFRGTTNSSEKEWLESRGVTATMQTEGNDKTSVMSQAAVTEALNKIREILGSAYHVVGAVDTLPKEASVGDIYYLRSDGHSYACTGREDRHRYSLRWKLEGDENPSFTPQAQSYLDAMAVGDIMILPCSTEDHKYFCPQTRDSDGKFIIVNCNEEGNVLSDIPVTYYNDNFHYDLPFPYEDTAVLVGTVASDTHITDAIYQDYGELQTFNFTPEAKDTSFEPSPDSMLSDTNNVQDGLNEMGIKTPSMELNLVTATNLNADILNANFREIAVKYSELVLIIQELIDKVEYTTSDGFSDLSERIRSLIFGHIHTTSRVTVGGNISSTTSVIGTAVCGEAICGTI